jgi:hypothetical protein
MGLEIQISLFISGIFCNSPVVGSNTTLINMIHKIVIISSISISVQFILRKIQVKLGIFASSEHTCTELKIKFKYVVHGGE